ncbi:LPS export ABC transporter permease LptF [Paludibacterium denitrificans]|uniref:LPS export ABC transporter permease LptF n=1 Tax=Paludibacterium denitrificans TaxID=2675226 RepID=UPI0035E45761
MTALIGFWALGFFPLLLILTVFVSVLVVMTRLWRDHEMDVWLSSGLSLKNWIWPIMRFAIPLAIVTGGITLLVSPRAEQRSQSYAEILKHREEISAISPGIFKESSSSSKVYFIEDYSGEHGAATNIFMQDMSGGHVASIFAKHGYLTSNKDGERVLVLEDGRRYVGEPGRADYEEAQFKRYSVIIGESTKFAGPGGDKQALSTQQLLADDSPKHRSELMWRLSMPLSCLVLALLAIPLSYYNPRSGHTYNLIFALLTFFLYQNGLTLARNWVSQGKVGVMAMLAVHLLFVVLALILLKHRNRPATTFSHTLRTLFRKS